MKAKYKGLLHIAPIIGGILMAISMYLPESIKIYSIVLASILLSVSIANFFIPNHSTKKYIRHLYNFEFIGKYKAVMHFETYDHKRESNEKEKRCFMGEKDVEWNIYFDQTLVLEQITAQAKSYGKYIYYVKDKGMDVHYFTYETEPLKQKDSNVPEHKGIFKIEVKDKNIISANYWVSKPGAGYYTNIKKAVSE